MVDNYYSSCYKITIMTNRPTAEEIVAFRARHGLTQQRLADRLGVHQVTVARWETRGTKTADRFRMARLASMMRRMESRKGGKASEQ